MLNLVGKIIALLLLPFLAYGFGAAFYEVLTKQPWQISRVLPFVIGFGLFALFWLIFKRFLQVFCTFEHELTHLIVGLLIWVNSRVKQKQHHLFYLYQQTLTLYILLTQHYFVPHKF